MYTILPYFAEKIMGVSSLSEKNIVLSSWLPNILHLRCGV